MHELSIAHAVVRTVVEALPDPAPRVTCVRLRIGELSGVVPQALEFAYEVAVEGTVLADAVLVIERSPIIIQCPSCGEQQLQSAKDFTCPSCHEPCNDIRGGKELEVIDITIDDAFAGVSA